MKQSAIGVLVLFSAVLVDAFVIRSASLFAAHHHAVPTNFQKHHATTTRLHLLSTLFQDEEEMIPIAKHYIRNKYKAVARSHGHKQCTAEDARKVLRSVLPPVTAEELEEEVSKTLAIVMKSNPDNTEQAINEDDFVRAIASNTYWEEAGSLVVKELMYFDSLHSYYSTGESLLEDDDYNELKDNLSWEGSSVATMNKHEALFVSAVASARRGDPVLDDEEYTNLKRELKRANSWVTNREADALERLGMDTFMGYLHRSLQESQ